VNIRMDMDLTQSLGIGWEINSSPLTTCGD
jgi:hypothetical protein